MKRSDHFGQAKDTALAYRLMRYFVWKKNQKN